MADKRRQWGALRKLPSGRYQASYPDPAGKRRTAPHTFDDMDAARIWLANMRGVIERGEWTRNTSDAGPLTFGAYASNWLEGRTLKPTTRNHYRVILDRLLLPAFGEDLLKSITPADVRAWHDAQDKGTPTMRAHTYALLRTILNSAVSEDRIPSNPCRIRGAGNVRRAKTIRPATLAELETVTSEMPERLRPMVLLAAWCALRFGELAELRRQDLDLDAGIVRVRRGVTRVAGDYVIGTPKSTAGVRDVAIPPHLLPMLLRHLDEHTAGGAKALLFPAADGRNYSASALDYHWRRAREAAGRPDLRFHDLRHTGAVLAASTGATLAELMARLGHSSPSMAMRYQHAAADRDKVIAAALSGLVVGI